MFDYQSPIPGVAVSQGWGKDRSYRGAGAWHEGLDFPVPEGTPVRAAGSGIVSFSAFLADDPAGNLININHPDGTQTRYMHLSQRIAQKGQQVTMGQLIGYSGRTGIKISGAHLHFDVRANPAALATYKAQFGTPRRIDEDGHVVSEFGRNIGGYVGIPGEAIIPATLGPAVIATAMRQGNPLYAQNSSSAGLFFLVAAAGLAYYVLT